MKTELIKYTVITLILFAVLLVLFFLNDYFGIIDTARTEAFSNYLGAVSSIVGVFVLIYLTLSVSSLDETRNKNNIILQKKITRTDFRQTALAALTTALDNPFRVSIEDNRQNVSDDLGTACIHLVNFINQKNYLFPILLSDETVKKKASELVELLSSFSQLLSTKNEIDRIHHKEILLRTMNSKNELIFILHEFMLNDLEN